MPRVDDDDDVSSNRAKRAFLSMMITDRKYAIRPNAGATIENYVGRLPGALINSLERASERSKQQD